MKTEKAKWVGIGFLILLGCFYLSNLYEERERSLWDFKTYYYAAQAFRVGQNPYEPTVLSELAGEEISLPFLYPPFTLVFFLPLTLVPFSSAFLLYLGLKLLAVIFLILIWRSFLGKDFDFLFFPFALVVYNSAIPLDFAAGNISVFEQILLWGGFLLFLRGNNLYFTFMVVLASLFKTTPLFFLILLFFSKDRRGWVYFLGGLATFGMIQGMAYLLYPGLMHDYSFDVDRILGDHESRGLWNPSTFALIRDVSYEAITRVGGEVGMRGPFIAYALVAAGCLTMTLKALWKIGSGDGVTDSETDRYRICLLSLLYILLVPRLQVYSYLIVIPSTFYFLKRWGDTKIYPLSLFFLMSLSAKDVFFPGVKQFYDFFWDYSPLLVVAFIWGAEIVSRWDTDEAQGFDPSSR